MTAINLGIRGLVDMLGGHPAPERVVIVGSSHGDARAMFDELVAEFDEMEVERVTRTSGWSRLDLFDGASVSTASLVGGSTRGVSADVVVLTRAAQLVPDARMLVAPMVADDGSVAHL